MSRLSVSIKLFVAFMGLTLIAASLGLYAVWSLSGMSRIAIDTYDKPLMATSYARAAALDAERLITAVRAYREAAPTKVGFIDRPLAVDRIVTASLGPSGSGAAALSERQRLLAFARVMPPISERERLLSGARGATGDSNAGRVRPRANPFSERQNLIARARADSLKSERARLIDRAREAVVVAELSTPSPIETANDATPQTVPAAAPASAAPTATPAPTPSQDKVASEAPPPVEAEKTAEADKSAQAADVDLAALRESIAENHEMLLENLAVVEERSFTDGIKSAAEESISMANAWGEENKALIAGEDGSGVSGFETLEKLIDHIDGLVEEVVGAGFEYRASAKDLADLETQVMYILIGLSIVLALAMAYATARFVVAPLKKAISAIGALADGDLTVELEVKSKDEVGDLANAVTILRGNLKEREDLQAAMASEEERNKLARVKARQELADRFKATFEQVVDNISVRMQELQGTARSLTSNAKDATGRAGQATESTGNTANNVQNVASATQELSASIGEIEQKVTETTRMVRSTAETASTSDAKISGLVDAVDKIGSVVGLIRDVTEQTNLLALNATIEAARAGEAGKGFAVVAQEVKTLAGQTARATEEIVQQIQAIQGSTTEAADAIRLVTDSVKQISDYTSGIAVAVEQQTAATREIAQSVEMAANGTSDTSQSMDSLLKSTNETAQSANTVSEASEMAAADATRLKEAVDDFVKELLAA